MFSCHKTVQNICKSSLIRNQPIYRLSARNKSIFVFGTFDTKGAETNYLHRLISNKLCKWSEPTISNTTVQLVDISTAKCVTYSQTDANSNGIFKVDYTCRDIACNWDNINKLERNESNAKITESLHEFIQTQYSENQINGVIAVGGSCGTSIASSIFTKHLPLGLPKMIISTMAASSITEKWIGSSDLIMMPSIVDISGVNDIYKIIAENAASSIVAMAQNYTINGINKEYKNTNTQTFTVAITMFGITTQCVEYIKSKLYHKYGDSVNVLIFHATGTGGKCMEYLIENGFINGVIDITTTEVADYVAGGILSCDKRRFDAAKNQKLPTIISLGAANVVNFGPKSDVASHLIHDNERIFHVHNEQITLMKANEEELKDIAHFIAHKMNEYEHVTMMIPKGGISALDDVDSQSLFAAYSTTDCDILTSNIEQEIKNKNSIKYVDAHINQEAFADSILNEFDAILRNMNIDICAQNISNQPNTKQLISDRFKKEGRRKQIMQSLYDKINEGEPIIGAGAGTGISAKCEVFGGADLIIIYNSGKYRMAGRGSLAGLLPFGDANHIVTQMAHEVIPIVKQQNAMIPVLAGVNGTDAFREMDRFLAEIVDLGFDGIQNFPTVGLIDGKFRSNLEETGFGYEKEVELMRIAKEKYDLITTPYVFDVAQCIQMAEVGVDIIVIHLGLTVGGNIGAKTTGMDLDECVNEISMMANAAYSVNKNQIILVHGGPIATPADVEFVFNNMSNASIIDGFYGASSMERLPVEKSISDTVKQFKSLRVNSETKNQKCWLKVLDEH